MYLLSNDVFRYGTHSSVDFLSDRLPVTNLPEPAVLKVVFERIEETLESIAAAEPSLQVVDTTAPVARR